MYGMTSHALADPGQIQAPVAQQVPTELNLHGDTRYDPYFWLRDVESNPAVHAPFVWIKARKLVIGQKSEPGAVAFALILQIEMWILKIVGL